MLRRCADWMLSHSLSYMLTKIRLYKCIDILTLAWTAFAIIVIFYKFNWENMSFLYCWISIHKVCLIRFRCFQDFRNRKLNLILKCLLISRQVNKYAWNWIFVLFKNCRYYSKDYQWPNYAGIIYLIQRPLQLTNDRRSIIVLQNM